MKIEYSELAASDLEAIADYHVSVGAAESGERIVRKICETVDFLRDSPLIGRQQDIAGVRKLVIPRSRYLVYYTFDEPRSEIVVLTVRHSARRQLFQDD